MNLKNEFSAAVLQGMMVREQNRKGEPRFTTPEEFVAFLSKIDGRRDQQAIADNIQRMIDVLKDAKFNTSIGEDFRIDTLKWLNDQFLPWEKRTDDPDSHLTYSERTEYNYELLNLLEDLDAQTWQTAVWFWGEDILPDSVGPAEKIVHAEALQDTQSIERATGKMNREKELEDTLDEIGRKITTSKKKQER